MNLMKHILLLALVTGCFLEGKAQQDSLPPATEKKSAVAEPGQIHDSLKKKRTVLPARDSVKRKSQAVGFAGDSLKTLPVVRAMNNHTHYPAAEPKTPEETRAALSYDQFLSRLLDNNHFFSNTSRPVPDFDAVRPARPADEMLFFVSFGILMLLAVIRLAFYKYFSDLSKAFFNATLSQRQLKEQLSQTPFPSFLLNIFFAMAGGFYFFLVLRHYHYIVAYNPLYLIPAFMLLIGLIYLVKYLFLKISGWLFGSVELVDGYIFIIYLINKVMGVALLPFIVLMAFGDDGIAEISLYIALSLIALLIVYRYIRTYGLIKNYIYFSKFHFFLYLCAFEIAPILIIGKLVLIWLNGTGG